MSVGRFPAKEQYEATSKLFTDEIDNLSKFESELPFFHRRFDRRLEELDTSESYPDEETLFTERARWVEEIQKFQNYGLKILEIQNSFAKSIKELDSINFNQFWALSQLSEQVCADAQKLNSDLELHKIELKKIHQRISDIYVKAQSELKILNEHTLVHFDQIIGRKQKHVEGPSASSNFYDRALRYLPETIRVNFSYPANLQQNKTK